MSSDARAAGPGPGANPVGLGAITLILALLLAASVVVVWELTRLLRQPTNAAQVAALDSATALRAAARTDSVARIDATARETSGPPSDTAVAGATARAARDSVARTELQDSQQRALRRAVVDSTLAAARADIDARLFLIVILSGALGGLLHAIRSFVWYVGNRDLRWSWVPTYLTLPPTSALLAAVMYFVVRAGFLGFHGSGDLNAYGFAGASALIGMFSRSAILKLKEVAETLFTRPPEGANARPEGDGKAADAKANGAGKTATPLAGDSAEGQSPVPVIIAASLGTDAGKLVLTIDGNGFRKTSELVVNATKVAITSLSPKKITAVLPDADGDYQALNVQVVTPPPGGGESGTVVVTRAVHAGARNG